jgi:ankyrin repeat protein
MLALDHTNAKWTRNTVEFLLANGVDLNARDATGKTALTYARESLARFANAEFRPVVELLLQAGASD